MRKVLLWSIQVLIDGFIIQPWPSTLEPSFSLVAMIMASSDLSERVWKQLSSKQRLVRTTCRWICRSNKAFFQNESGRNWIHNLPKEREHASYASTVTVCHGLKHPPSNVYYMIKSLLSSTRHFSGYKYVCIRYLWVVNCIHKCNLDHDVRGIRILP